MTGDLSCITVTKLRRKTSENTELFQSERKIYFIYSKHRFGIKSYENVRKSALSKVAVMQLTIGENVRVSKVADSERQTVGLSDKVVRRPKIKWLENWEVRGNC